MQTLSEITKLLHTLSDNHKADKQHLMQHLMQHTMQAVGDITKSQRTCRPTLSFDFFTTLKSYQYFRS